MAYGSVLTDTVQSSTAATPVVFKDGNGTQIGTLCRAWVNFNGTGTVAIRASFNVSSITDNGTGNYTVNFTTAMPDTNYSVVVTAQLNDGGTAYALATGKPTTTSQAQLILVQSGTSTTLADSANVQVAVFR